MTPDTTMDPGAPSPENRAGAPVRAFISYAHERDPNHRAGVLLLADLLNANGVQTDIDRYLDNERDEWAAKIDNLITAADYVLVVVSPEYRRRAHGEPPYDVGRGVVYEVGHLRDLLYTDRAAGLRKVVPVVLPGGSAADIPRFLVPGNGHRIELASLTTSGITPLLRLLTGQPAHSRPILGPVPVLPPENEPYIAPEPPGRMNFSALMAERTGGFVGREWAVAQIDRHLAGADFAAGYVMVTGEPGSGKTTLLSHLIRQRDYVHHFNIIGQGIRSSESFYANVCGQLSSRYGLAWTPIPRQPADRPQHLLALLRQALSAADGAPVTVVVDALDESATDDLDGAANWLLLPSALPVGVHFVVSSRELKRYRLPPGFRPVTLGGVDEDNLRDIDTYLRRQLDEHRAELAPQLLRWNVGEDGFRAILTERSGGNFMYLVHVLGDIRAGRLTRDTLDRVDQLPAGLRAYYETHWEMMRGRDPGRLEKLYEPVLKVLAVAREPVDLAFLSRHSGCPSQRVNEVLREWSPFLTEVPGEAGRRYRIYHASFREFLAEEGAGLPPTLLRMNATTLRQIPGYPDADDPDADDPDADDPDADDPETDPPGPGPTAR